MDVIPNLLVQHVQVVVIEVKLDVPLDIINLEILWKLINSIFTDILQHRR